MDLCWYVQFLLRPVVASTLALVVGVFLYYQHWARIRRLTKHIPGPPEFPLFGNVDLFTETLDFSEVNHKIFRAFDKYGSVFKLWMSHELWICLCDFKLAKEISDFWATYDAIPAYNFFGYAKDGALFIKKTFYGTSKFYDIFLEPKLEEESLKEATENLTSSLESVSERASLTAVEIRLAVLEAVKSIMTETTWKLKLKDDIRAKFIKTLQTRWDLFLLRTTHRVQQYIADGLLKFMEQYHLAGIKMHTACFDKAPEPDRSLIKCDFKASELKLDFVEELKLHLKDEAFEHTTKEISEAVENTATFFLNLLQDVAGKPEVIAKIRQEVDSLRQKNGGNWPRLADERKLYYTEMVIKEGLRLYSPPGLFKRAGKKFTKGEIVIPEGTIVYISAQHLHSSHEFYRQPTQFCPEHFSYERERDRPFGAYFPLVLEPCFSSDPRYVLKFLKFLLISLVTNFELETSKPAEEINHDYFLMRKNLETLDLKARPL